MSHASVELQAILYWALCAQTQQDLVTIKDCSGNFNSSKSNNSYAQLTARNYKCIKLKYQKVNFNNSIQKEKLYYIVSLHTLPFQEFIYLKFDDCSFLLMKIPNSLAQKT